MPDLPRGTVTFHFTDIEGSTARWEGNRYATATAVARHVALLETAIRAYGGTHVKTVGDAVQAAFPTAPQSVTAAVIGQRALLAKRIGGKAGCCLFASPCTPGRRNRTHVGITLRHR